MSTLAEIEAAVSALPPAEQEALWRLLGRRLAGSGDAQKATRWLVPPPAVPREELRRVHALIEAEFSQTE